MRVSAPAAYMQTKNIHRLNVIKQPHIMSQLPDRVSFGKKDKTEDKEPVENKKKFPFKIKHPVRTAALIAMALYAATSLRSCAFQPKVYPIQEVRENAEDILFNFKFEKADLIYDINNVLNGKRLPDDSLGLYWSNVTSSEPKTYMSENAGQMNSVLAIASISDGAKNQVQAEKLTPYLLRALQYDRTGLLDETNDAVTGEGEPWHYIAAAIVSKEYPELIEYMPEAQKKALQEKGVLEGLWDDIKFTIGSGEEYPHYLGDTLERRDRDYARYVLTNDISAFSLPSDNPWFGPVAVGYAIRGNLGNLEGMSFDQIEALRMGYVNDNSNKQRFMTDEGYRNQVTSSYILHYMREAILQNTGKIASGLSALGLQQAGFMDKEISTELLRQVAEEAPKMRLFNNEANKLDIAIKTFVLWQEGRYIELSADTRKEIRKFQVNNPSSTATSVFMLAEEAYLRDLKELMESHQMLQEELDLELKKADDEKDLTSISATSSNLLELSQTILPIVEQEIKVASATNDVASFQNMKRIQEKLEKQNAQLFVIMTGAKPEEAVEDSQQAN